MRRPILFPGSQRCFDQLGVDALALQFPADPGRPVTFFDPVVDQGLGITAITLQTFGLELGDDPANQVRLVSAAGQLALEFLLAVLTPGQEGECPLPDRVIILTQASASSSSTALTVVDGMALARMAASIS